jgi:hypothetical protein
MFAVQLCTYTYPILSQVVRNGLHIINEESIYHITKYFQVIRMYYEKEKSYDCNDQSAGIKFGEIMLEQILRTT